MFPNGWPGKGLLILRGLVSAILLYDGVAALAWQLHGLEITLLILAALMSLLFLIGLWTPLIGLSIAILEILIALVGAMDPRCTFLLVGICLSIAMLGPGVWSIDSVLYGRKRLRIEDR